RPRSERYRPAGHGDRGTSPAGATPARTGNALPGHVNACLDLRSQVGDAFIVRKTISQTQPGERRVRGRAFPVGNGLPAPGTSRGPRGLRGGIVTTWDVSTAFGQPHSFTAPAPPAPPPAPAAAARTCGAASCRSRTSRRTGSRPPGTPRSRPPADGPPGGPRPGSFGPAAVSGGVRLPGRPGGPPPPGCPP